jgi:hypothetical protein
MSIYLREQSAGEILRGTVSIYFRNFLPLFGMYFLPIFPIVLVKPMTLELGCWWVILAELGMWLLVTPFAVAVLTVGVSDICLGNPPSLLRSLRRVFGVIFGKLVVTNLLMFLVYTALILSPALGLLYLETSVSVAMRTGATALWFSMAAGAAALFVLCLIWWVFVPTVVVLERTFGWTALKRSKALGKGYYLRNTLVVFLFSPIYILGMAILFGTLGSSALSISHIVGAVIMGLLAPLPLIAMVLLYYDLRARSEGYDLAMLGQDLRR